MHQLVLLPKIVIDGHVLSGEVVTKSCPPNPCNFQYSVYPLGQGRAIARPQPTRAYSTSALSQYKPLLLYIPPHLYPAAQTTIKAEPSACNTTQTSYLFVPRHGGSSEPALPPTEALDQ